MSEAIEQKRKIEPAQWWVIALVVSASAGALIYRLLLHQHLGQSAAMFLGIPAVLAIVLALAPKARTVTGGILKGITFALLIIAPLLGEGYLCILVASPLFYLIGIVVGLAVDHFRSKRLMTLSCVALLLLPMCLEGVIPQLTWNRLQTVRVSSVVVGSMDAVERALTMSPRVQTTLPPYLRI